MLWGNHTCVSTESREVYETPDPVRLIVNVKESHVSVMFKPTDSCYNFGRLADPEDIARYGPLSRSPNVRHAKTGVSTGRDEGGIIYLNIATEQQNQRVKNRASRRRVPVHPTVLVLGDHPGCSLKSFWFRRP
jgi:hypothetical protein